MKFADRAEAVLANTFRGIHNVPGKIVKEPRMWSVAVMRGLATYDFDELTRLVLSAHEQCVRVEVEPCMRYLKIFITDRNREGSMYERHPEISEVLNSRNSA